MQFLENQAVLPFHGEVKEENVSNLADGMRLAVDYYRYQHIVITLNSEGGQSSALDYFITQRNWLREREVQLTTVALMRVYSAAAIMFALGDEGRRIALPGTELLFHEGRIRMDQNTTLTADALTTRARSLRGVDRRYEELLLNHLYGWEKSAGRKAPSPAREASYAASAAQAAVQAAPQRQRRSEASLDPSPIAAFRRLWASEQIIGAERAQQLKIVNVITNAWRWQ
jgi:ATP-dependent protease ClpP protease subunit